MFNKAKLRIFQFSFLLLVLCYFPSHGFGANFPLEIIQPRSGLTTANRFYKAYPGLVYDVRAGVIGGAYPYSYSLTTAPSGMTIDQNTGVITWSNPITSGSPFSVTMKVVDGEGAQATVSWTVSVTTSGFLFLDAVNGKSVANGGTGTLANPWRTMNDFYKGNKYDTTYANYFAYFRNGTYYIDTPVENTGTIDARTPYVANYKPEVWLAYPGESPVIDYQMTEKSIIFYAGNSNVYLDGLEFKNFPSYGIQMESNQLGMVYRRLKMHDSGATDGSNNQSAFRVLAAGQGEYLTIQDSEIYNLQKEAAVKLYQTDKFLLEDNYLHDFNTSVYASEGFALKQDVTRGTVRHNRIYNVANHSIGGNMNSQTWTTQNSEILFNRVWGSGEVDVNQNGNAATHYYYRNTFECPVNILQPGPGIFYFSNNVIQNSTASISGTTTNTVESGDLKGTSGLVDSNGNLTTSYSTNIGLKGWQFSILGTQISALTPPPNLRIITTN